MLGVMTTLWIALLVCCRMSISVSKRRILENSMNYSITELDRLESNFMTHRQDFETSGEELTMQAMLKYCFFEQTRYSDIDTEYVLQTAYRRVIYNKSGIDPAAILELDTNADLQADICRIADASYIVCGKSLYIKNMEYQMYLVRDITSVYGQLRRLALMFLVIACMISAMAGIFVFFFLRKTLKPLEQMKREAEFIAEGKYDARIEMEGKDELADLAHSINRMAEAVEQHIHEVEEISEARNRLIHALAHEMRTPVTAISGYSYALRSLKMQEEQKQDALEFIDLEAKRLARLSAKLTELVGLSSANIELQRIDLADMKKQLEMIFRDQNHICLCVEDGQIRGDQDLLILLITNLCDNARKAGATRITVEVTPTGIWVKDNGIGISESDQQHIFEAFYQGDESRNQEGFGLGLALCRKIAELHNTRIQVSSEEGRGSTFYLYNSFTTP